MRYKKKDEEEDTPASCEMSNFGITGSATFKISVKATILVSDLGYQYRARTRDAFSAAAWAAPFENVTRPFDSVQRYGVSSTKLKFSKIAIV